LLDPSASSAQIIACDHDSGNKELWRTEFSVETNGRDRTRPPASRL
jgi:hypothetical protein